MPMAVISTTKGLAVTSAPNGLPVVVATNGYGVGVVPVASGGLPVFDTSGTLFGPAVIPANTGLPVITGSTVVGQTLVTTVGTWSGTMAAYTFQWKRGGVDISGATSNTYLLVTADLGVNVTVTVTATNTAGSASATSAAVGPVTATLDAPTLTWESTPEINPPLLVLGIPDNTLAGDHGRIEISSDGGSTWALYIDVTIVNPDAGSMSGTAAALPTGAYTLRARMERGAAFSAWSTSISINVILDTTAPTIVSFNPPDNTTGVSRSTDFILTFSEPIALGASGTVTLKKTSDNSTIETWDIATEAGSGPGQIKINGLTGLQMRLTSSLAPSTEYYIVATAGVVKDVGNNPSSAISSTTQWSFTTTSSTGWTSPLDASTPAVFWVDASNTSSVIRAGTAVSAWNDLTTGGHNLTSRGGSAFYTASAINGLPGVDTNAMSGLASTAFTVAQPLMVVVVWKQSGAGPATQAFLFDGDLAGAAANRLIIINKWTGGNYNTFGNNLVDQGVAVAAGTAYHTRAIFNGASSSSKLNASVLTGTNPGPGSIQNGIQLSSSSTFKSNAIYCEIYVIPNPTAADITNSDAYVLAKWGLA
jgi:hypothetical protein